MLEGVLKVNEKRKGNDILTGFNPWYVGGGVKSCCDFWEDASVPGKVSILGMLEGVLKAAWCSLPLCSSGVSILGMLEGVLKAFCSGCGSAPLMCFNPWYVGGGVKSAAIAISARDGRGFNPWYVGGGVKSM